MPNAATNRTDPDLRALRHELADADDDKVRRIVALVDQQGAPPAARAILDPLRPRLALLRPPRPLRFARLLFLPFDPLIVPPAAWRVGEPTIPRGILVSLADTVHAGLGPKAAEIDRLIGGRTTHDEAVIVQAGDMLWPAAADVLATAPAPIGWDATGLPLSAYAPLARAVAALLRRTRRLRDLAREVELGALEPSEDALREILTGIAAESPAGCAMIVALLLEQLPGAALRLRHLLGTHSVTAESAMLREAMDRGLDGVLTQMESPTGFDDAIQNAPLQDVGQEIRRISELLRDVEAGPDTARHRPRLKTIRAKLDQACRTRFGTGLTTGLVAPLAAGAGPVAADTQTAFETNARELRTLEIAARRIGGAVVYDALLEKATDAVRDAATAGILSPVRKLRLIEILAGPEAAEATYREDFRPR